MKPVSVFVATVLLFAGCSGGADESTTDPTTTAPVEMNAVRVYFVRDGKVWPVLRELEATEAVASAALGELFEGPTEQEQTDLDLKTAIPDGEQSVEVARLSISGGIAVYDPPRELRDAGLAQLIYTLTQFPTVRSVEIGEKSYTRLSVEDFAPAVLVESPLPFEEVTSPLRVTGTANTFEATFSYELTDTDGRIVDENFVTATSGTGTRGTFDFTTKPYTVPFDGVGALIVFERSAKDGSRINIIEIPLRMTR